MRRSSYARKSDVKAFLSNPLVAVLPLVGLLFVAWLYYISPVRSFNTSTNNVLPSGSFDQFGSGRIPLGWKLVKTGELEYDAGKSKGYIGGNSFMLNVHGYKNGDISFISPKVDLKSDTTYLFKGYYLANTGFELLAKYYYADGTSKTTFIRDYPYNDEPWSTVAAAFATGQTIKSVQLIYQMHSNGTLRLDDTYLEPRASGVYLAPDAKPPSNVVPNPGLDLHKNNTPTSWLTYHSGNNLPTFSYIRTHNSSYLQVAMENYKDGEAKWQYNPLPVQPGQRFYFSVDYQSTMPVDVVVEYELENGQRRFHTPRTLQSTAEWTTFSTQLEVPPLAKNMFVSLILHGNGTLKADNYFLGETTKPGLKHFERPLVSITFDDGWQSAYQEGARLLDQYGYKGTFYLNSSTIDTGIFVSTPQVQDLQVRKHQLAAHGDEHIDMTTVNARQLDHQFKSPFQYLRNEFGIQNIDFATPYGRDDPEVQAFIRKYYRSHRGTETGINTRQNFDPYEIAVLFVTQDTPLATLQAALREAKEYNGWLVLVYHRIEDKPDTRMAASPKVFTEHLEAIKQSGITVKTVDGALREIEAQID